VPTTDYKSRIPLSAFLPSPGGGSLLDVAISEKIVRSKVPVIDISNMRNF
jgi:hypothetical protein